MISCLGGDDGAPFRATEEVTEPISGRTWTAPMRTRILSQAVYGRVATKIDCGSKLGSVR